MPATRNSKKKLPIGKNSNDPSELDVLTTGITNSFEPILSAAPRRISLRIAKLKNITQHLTSRLHHCPIQVQEQPVLNIKEIPSTPYNVLASRMKCKHTKWTPRFAAIDCTYFEKLLANGGSDKS